MSESDYITAQVIVKIKRKEKKKFLAGTAPGSVLHFSTLRYETYPFEPRIIKYKGNEYKLTNKLKCTVEFKDGKYIISCDDLSVSAWGKTREEAESAFNFVFHSLCINYLHEKNANLTTKAIVIKRKLKNLVS